MDTTTKNHGVEPCAVSGDAATPPGRITWSDDDWTLITERNRIIGEIEELQRQKARALQDLRRTLDTTHPEVQEMQRQLRRELRKLLPTAIRQAKANKPALLRLITRSLRSL